jgi:CRISPR-associated protein Csd2
MSEPQQQRKNSMTNEQANNQDILRATGLLIIEVTNSNPNGDPDRESDPRQRPDEKGEISPVSFKRKLRDLVDNKEGPVWDELSKQFTPPLKADQFEILESRGRKRDIIKKELQDNRFVDKYWDARVFGNTFLEEEASTFVRTGVVQFALGLSVAPIHIERMTNTNKSGVQKGKDRGMAPLAYRVVQHGVYCMPFFINPTAATAKRGTGCTKRDIDLLLKLIRPAYPHTASAIRPFVGIRHAWYIEHTSRLGSCSDFALIDALTPKRKKEFDPKSPSLSWDEYDVPTCLPQELARKVNPLCDWITKE